MKTFYDQQIDVSIAPMRIGVDIVDVGRLARRLAEWPRLARRLFTGGELLYAQSRSRPDESLAARLAAKEATFKALGGGWPQISWHDVEVVSIGGRPELLLGESALRLAGGAAPSVSLSHDGGFAIAQVLLQVVTPVRTRID